MVMTSGFWRAPGPAGLSGAACRVTVKLLSLVVCKPASGLEQIEFEVSKCLEILCLGDLVDQRESSTVLH